MSIGRDGIIIPCMGAEAKAAGADGCCADEEKMALL